MKRLTAFLMACLLLLSACGPAPTDTMPDTPSAAPEQMPPAQEASKVPDNTPASSAVMALAHDRATALGASAEDGEAAVRTLYRYLVEQVCFANPVGLYAWRYLPGADPNTPVPYLENRALGPLLFEIGSCEDFAAAMVLLLRAAGFEADYVAGFTVSVDGDYVDHAWAVVRLGNEWYHLDPQLEQNVTERGMLTYRYYLRGDEHMLADHRWGENLISYWGHMSEGEKAAIRESYTPPACPKDYPTPGTAYIASPARPNMADVENTIARLKRESGLSNLEPIPLNVEPPVLVAEYHITPLFDPAEASGGKPADYGRRFLSGAASDLYDALDRAAALGADTAPYDPALTSADINNVISAFKKDRPEYYYLAIAPAGQDTPYILSLGYTAGMTRNTAEAQRIEIEDAAYPLIVSVLRQRDHFKRIEMIHDYISGQVAYDSTPPDDLSASIYGALVRGRASCEGYARAFQYLCRAAGYECVYIEGSNPQGVPHAWNAVKIEGDWYYADTTYDRPLGPDDGIYHDYFLLTTEEIRREHRPNARQYPSLPEANQAGYYERMGYAVWGPAGENAARQAAEALVKQLCDRPDALSRQGGPAFLEIKVLGDEAAFQSRKQHFIKEMFAIQRLMAEKARQDGLPFRIDLDSSVKCHFNSATRIITFYPKVRKEEVTP